MVLVPGAEKTVGPGTLPAARVSVSGGAGAFGALEATAARQIGGLFAEAGAGIERREELVTEESKRVVAQKQKAQLAYKNDRDKVYADRAVVEYQDWFRGYKVDPLSRQGLDADGVTNQAIKDVDKFKKTLLDDAENDAQRLLIETKLASERDVGLNRILAHETTQFKSAKEQAVNATIENSIRAGSENFDDPLAMFKYEKSLRQAIQVKTEGMPKQARKNVTDELISTFHEGILNQKVVADSEDAQEYYKLNKKNILPENRASIEAGLEKFSVIQESKEAASFITLKESDFVKQREAVQKMPGETDHDAAVKKKTKERIKIKQDEVIQLREDKKDDVIENTQNGIINASSYESALDIIDSISPEETGLSPVDIDDLKAFAKSRKTKKQAQTKTNKERYIEALDRIEDGQIIKRSQLLQYAGYVTDADFKTLESRFTNKSKQDTDAKIPEASLSTAKESIAVARGKSAYDPKTDDKMLLDVLKEHEKAARVKGDALSDLEAAEITADLMILGKIPGSGVIWDDEVTWPDAVRSNTDHLWLPRVNDEDIDKGEERRLIKEWSAKVIEVDDPSDELMSLIKKEAILGKELWGLQLERYHELIEQEKR